MISVIVAVYNAEEYLEECIDSILSQSYRDIEVILVNDGSTDGSGDLCEAFAENDDRIVVLHRENGGVSEARNTGLDAAKGDVIAFVDCDDYILPGMYEALLEKMKETRARIAVCTVIDEQEDGRKRKFDTGETMLISGREALRKLVTGMGDRGGHRETIWFSVWNKLYDAKLFNTPKPCVNGLLRLARNDGQGNSDEEQDNDLSGQANNFFGEGIRFDPETDSAEDVPVNLAAFAKVDHILYYEKPYYFWRYREASQTNMKEPNALRGGSRTSRYLFDSAKTLAEKDRRETVTAAVRHFYWYYTGCVYALSLSRKLAKKGEAAPGREPEDYLLLRKYMLASLVAIVSDPYYKKYTDKKFKAAVWFMLNTPGMFGALWLFYRRLKRLRSS